jgi:hypothetical protein
MIIKVYQETVRTIKKKDPEGNIYLEEVLEFKKTVRRSIQSTLDFQELRNEKTGKLYKKRCLIFTDQGPLIAAHSFEDLDSIINKTNQIGFNRDRTRFNRR